MRKIISFLIWLGKPILSLVKLPRKIRIVKKKKEKVKKVWGWKYPAMLMIVLSITLGLVFIFREIVVDLPNVNEIYNPPSMSTKIYDRKGNILYQFYKDEDRSWIPLNQIPESLIKATLAAEDKDFYKHHGFSIRGIAQAIWYNLKNSESSRPRGGSTITQQLAKNVFLNGEKTWRRKVKEAILALMLEGKLSKEEILERYFNQVPYGGNIYGAMEAANRYFGKDIREINLAEATFLAGLPAAPSFYSPFTKDGFELARNRQKHVIEEMVTNGVLSPVEAEEVTKEKITIIEDKKDIQAPHFVFYVREYLEKLGFSEIERRGLKVTTSLDLDIQKNAEKVVATEISKVKKLKIFNGAALILNVKEGEVLAMVGSKDYFAKDIDGKFNVVTQALRQPGSSIKPINYLLALQKGKSFLDKIEDSPISYNIPGQKAYVPQNYTGKYLGKVTLKTALASSLNIPSVKLLNENGVDKMIDLAEKMGITTWKDRSRFGLSLALGAGEVKMIELAGAYSIFANLGEKVELNPILEVKNYLGETVYSKQKSSEEVIEAKYAYLINNTLSDDQARAPIFGTNSLLHLKGKTVAVKTGTTNNLKDNWCIGWTPSYLVATWVGNNDSLPMSWVASGISGATPIWNQIMKQVLAKDGDEPWSVPEGVYKSKACGVEDWFVDGEEKKIQCLTPTTTITPEER